MNRSKVYGIPQQKKNIKPVMFLVLTLFLVGQGLAQENSDKVTEQIKLLKSLDADVRRSAADALGQMRAEAKQVIPALIEALKDQNEDVRGAAADALMLIGAEAVPALIEALKDQNENVRHSAAFALGQMEEEAVPALIGALKNQNENVRSSAADALGQMRAETKPSIPALIEALKDQNEDVRISAAFALVNMETGAKQAIPVLIETLKNQNENVRSNAADALGRMGEEAEQAIPALIDALKDQNEDVRRSAASALGRMGEEAVPALIEALKNQNENARGGAASALGQMQTGARQAIPALIDTLKDQNKDVRRSAADALGRMGEEAEQAIPALIDALKDQNEDVRISAADALGQMQTGARQAIPALIDTLKDQNEDVRISAAFALMNVETEAKQAIPALIEALKNQDVHVRSSAADALGKIGADARQAIPALTEALKDQEEFVHRSAADALSKIAKALFNIKATEVLPQLKKAHTALLDAPEFKDQAFTVKQTIDYFESLWWAGLTEKIRLWFENHSIVGGIIFSYLFLIIFWWLTFWLRPLWLLSASAFLSRYEPKLKTQNLEIGIPLRHILLISLFHYRNRVLDAWGGKYLATARENFTNLPTVSQRKISVSLPVSINGLTSDLSIDAFQSLFDKSKVTILIAGEGGAGKTSLACQMATWAMETNKELRLDKTHSMLPVFIENNLESVTEGKEVFALIEAVHGRLRDLIGMSEPIFDELLIQLLHKRRVLVIVDSLSELNEKTRKSVMPTNKDFPITALVVTSRIEEKLGDAAKRIIKPLRLKSNGLSTFFHDYLSKCGKRELFEDEEFFNGCRLLAQIVDDREITVLIAKMFAEQMIASKEQTSDRSLPRNLPDLMQGYIKTLNEQIKDDKIDTLTVLHIARLIAVKCLEQSYRPVPVKITEVIKVINADKDATEMLKNTDTKALLKYLEERLQIIQITGVIGDEIRFSLDPLAEYLTGLYLVETYGAREERWENFIEVAQNQSGAPEAIKGLLLAVRDCCVEKGGEYRVPEETKDKLARMAGLDPETVNAAQLSQRINRLVANLKLPDAEDRIMAIETLYRIGSNAKAAIPALIEALKDQNEYVRSSTAELLGKMRAEAKQAIPHLIDALKDQNDVVRICATSALGNMGIEARQAIPALTEALRDQDEDVRFSAAEALGKMGAEATQASPD